MFDRRLRQQKLLFFLMVFLLSLTLACGLTQGFSSSEEEAPTPIVDLGQQGGSQDSEQKISATINEPPAPKAKKGPPAETEASPTPEDEDAPDSTLTETPAADDEADAQPSGELAENQIFIVPGG